MPGFLHNLILSARVLSACPDFCAMCVYDTSSASTKCMEGGCEVGSREFMDNGDVTCDECLDDCDFCVASGSSSSLCMDQQCDAGFGISATGNCVSKYNIAVSVSTVTVSVSTI